MNYAPEDKTPTAVDRLIRAPGVLLAAGLVVGVVAVVVLILIFPLLKPLLEEQFSFSVIFMAALVGIIMSSTAVCILAERKIAGFIQDRKGPNRAGFWGLLQPMADGLKFFLKEDITPGGVDRRLFLLAPCISFFLALLGFAIIPWAGNIHWPWMPAGEAVSTQVASLDVGVLYIIAVGSLGVYGIVLAGWSSNNKYSFFGGIRATAQMLSYEVPLGLGLLCVLLVAGTLRLEVIVEQQAESGVWNVFLHPLPFLLVFISTLAEANRAPFDLPEAEQELVGGYHTEYSSMKFAMFFLAEYAHMVTASALMVALFFGGWHVWFLPGIDNTAWWAGLLKFGVYWVKIACFIGFFMLIRWTLPRFRFDQLMRLAWKSMVPVGMGLVVVSGILVALGWQRHWYVSLPANALVLFVMILVASRSRAKVTGRQADLPDIEVRPAN